MSLTNSIKASEKFEIFKKLSQQYMMLSQEIEACDANVSKETYNILTLKYDNLIQDCAFEEIPLKYKIQVATCFSNANRFIPIQLNGIIGNTVNIKKMSQKNLFQEASLVNISNIPPTELKTSETAEKIQGSGENV
jgi:hypothetical protein